MKARTIRSRAALAGWLHQVGHRIAVQINIDAARRRAQYRPLEGLDVAVVCAQQPDADSRAILHEEITRLSQNRLAGAASH